jgi:hypothetical protein
MLAGIPESTGARVSTTVTVNEADAVLPCVSVAVHVTVDEPTGNVDPEAGEQLTATAPSTRSLAVGVAYETAAPAGPAASTAAGLGTPEIAGAVVSTTVTVNESDA